VAVKVVLINGETLAQLMIGYDAGVTTAAQFQLKKIDHDFFNLWATPTSPGCSRGLCVTFSAWGKTYESRFNRPLP
jgi:hypothetical protein